MQQKIISKIIGLLFITNAIILFPPILFASEGNQELLSKLVTEGVMYSVNNSPEKAIPLFDTALELSVDNIWILGHRAAAYRKMNEHTKALVDYKKLIDLADTLAEKHFRIGRMYWAYMKFNEALKEMDKAIELESTNSLYFECRATVKMNLDLYEEAVQDYSRAIELKPNNRYAFSLRALAYHWLGKENEALQDEEIAKKLNFD